MNRDMNAPCFISKVYNAVERGIREKGEGRGDREPDWLLGTQGNTVSF